MWKGSNFRFLLPSRRRCKNTIPSSFASCSNGNNGSNCSNCCSPSVIKPIPSNRENWFHSMSMQKEPSSRRTTILCLLSGKKDCAPLSKAKHRIQLLMENGLVTQIIVPATRHCHKFISLLEQRLQP